jgi:hypothetical protein
MVNSRWHYSENHDVFNMVPSLFHNRTIVVSRSYHCIFIVVSSPLYHRERDSVCYSVRLQVRPTYSKEICLGKIWDKCAFLPHGTNLLSCPLKILIGANLSHKLICLGRRLRSHLSHVGQMRPHRSYVRQMCSETNVLLHSTATLQQATPRSLSLFSNGFDKLKFYVFIDNLGLILYWNIISRSRFF